MQQLGQYVVSITALALISGFLLALLQNGAARSLVRLLSGILLIMTAISPLNDVSIPEMTEFAADYFQEGKEAAGQGELIARKERTVRIKKTLEEYICDKAAAMGVNLHVSVSLDELDAPVSIKLIGNHDEKIQQELQSLITKELGIRKENQEWIGQTGKMP